MQLSIKDGRNYFAKETECPPAMVAEGYFCYINKKYREFQGKSG